MSRIDEDVKKFVENGGKIRYITAKEYYEILKARKQVYSNYYIEGKNDETTDPALFANPAARRLNLHRDFW